VTAGYPRTPFHHGCVLLGDDIVQALQAKPATSGELAAQLGVTSRHIRRSIADIILGKFRPAPLHEGQTITATREGRNITYSVVEEAAASSSSSITTVPGRTEDNSGHKIADMSAIDCGHSSAHDSAIADIGKNSGHDCGHADLKTTKQRYRNRKTTAISYGPATIGPRPLPGFQSSLTCEDSGTNLCPQFYAGFERDMIRFVLVDKPFRDLLMAKVGQWTVNKTHNGHQTWVHPTKDLTLQVGLKDTVVFYSAEPGEDLSGITGWVESAFPEYGDIPSLLKKIKSPSGLVGEEVTVVVRHEPTITAIRSSIGKMTENGQWNLMPPSENVPGLKIYETHGTMRVEFIVTNHAQGLAAINMRERLMLQIPRIHKSPGLFWEIVQKYYSHMLHPQINDTGAHEFIQTLEKIQGESTGAIREITQGFTSTLMEIVAKIPQVKDEPGDRFQEVEEAIAAFKAELELEDIIRVFQRTLKLDEQATRVFLAAWSAWQARNFRGRILKEDVSSMLIRQGSESLTLEQIADAIVRLKAVKLLQEDTRLEIRISPGATALCRKMVASREGIQ